jgi:hypothetical protein
LLYVQFSIHLQHGKRIDEFEQISYQLQPPPFQKPVSILLLIIKELQGYKKKREVENDLQFIMAPVTGLDSATF